MEPLGPVRFITVHCSATPEGRDVKAAQISKWDIARFGQVSYHAVIELDGRIIETLPPSMKGAHTGGHNSNNYGICYVGGVCADNKTPKDTRTPAQKASMHRLIADLKARYQGVKVLGHRDWPGVAKACPSFDVSTEL